MGEQALAQVGEVPVGVSGRRHALVHLDDMHAGPWHLFIGQRPQHLPRGVPSADGHDEATARGHGRARLRGGECGARSRDRIGIGQHLDPHGTPHRRVLPAAGRRNARVDLFGSPGARLVFVDGRAGLQHRIDDSPRLFDVVLPGKQGGVSLHGVPQHPLVRVHLLRVRDAGSPASPRSGSRVSCPGAMTFTPIAIVTSGLIRNRQ